MTFEKKTNYTRNGQTDTCIDVYDALDLGAVSLMLFDDKFAPKLVYFVLKRSSYTLVKQHLEICFISTNIDIGMGNSEMTFYSYLFGSFLS